MNKCADRLDTALAIMVALLASAWCATSAAQTAFSFPWQGQQRSSIVHLPSSYPSGAPYPLLIACHPGQSNAGQHAAASGWHLVGDTAGFITVYPDAMPPGANPNARLWNAYDQPSLVAQYDDVGFLLKLMDTLITLHPIDTCRMYMSGFSNGAMMTFRMACEAADRLAAIAPVSGGWGYGADGSCGDGQCNGDPAGTCGWSMAHVNCTPARQLPVAFMKGSLEGDNLPTCRATIDSLQRVFWTGFLGCGPALTDTLSAFGETIVRERFTGCADDAEYRFHTVLGNSHVWHSPATPLMWAFLRERSRCDLVTANGPGMVAHQPAIAPNPCSDGFRIALDAALAPFELRDAAGRLVMRIDGPEADTRHLRPGVYLLRSSANPAAAAVRIAKH